MKAQTVSLLLAISLALSVAGYAAAAGDDDAITTVAITTADVAITADVAAAANAQALQTADRVIINEIDTNPPGDDSKTISEWIEIYNPTPETVDIGGWEIASTAALKKTLSIPAGHEIRSGQFLTYSYQPAWFADASESVELRDSNGDVVDRTPLITDLSDDLRSWQRVYDALDSDGDSDWAFETPSAGSTNGSVEPVSGSEPVSVSISPAKTAYLFGEYAVLHGSVSEKLYVEKPTFVPVQIVIDVSGPNDFERTVTLYPDLNLEFSTDIGLQQVLGVHEGVYDVTARYGDASAAARFSVGHELIETEAKRPGMLDIATDEDSYIPGQTVVISASTTEEIPLEGLKFSVIDPAGEEIAQGTLFPSSDVNVRGVFGDPGQAQFVTRLFVDTASPSYGKYRIVGQYSAQTAEHTFDVVADGKENVPISLGTDKPAYEPGETVVISGRSNQQWVPSLSLEVVKSANIALGTGDFAGGGSDMKVLDTVRLEGDGTFGYEIEVPTSFESFGEYRVTVDGEIGTSLTKFAIVEDSANFEFPDESLYVVTDKEIYDVGETIRISGSIRDQEQSSDFVTAPVTLTVADAGGDPLSFVGLPDRSETGTRDGATVDLSFTAIPDATGNFVTNTEAVRSFYDEGAYTITARYGELESSVTFVVTDPLDVGSSDIVAVLDKEVYGLGETLSLSGKFGAQTTDSQGIVFTLYKPDGDTDKFGTTIQGGFFSWTWDTPTSEVSSGSENDRVVSKSNLGTYRLNVDTGGHDADVFFKVSDDPENDSIVLDPLTVSVGKPLYKPGESLLVHGNVLARVQGDEGLVVPDRVTIRVFSNVFPYPVIHEAKVFPDYGGHYQSSFELPATLFLEGTYKVRSTYSDVRAETQFGVVSGFAFGGDDDLELTLALDKETYHPGDVLTLSGRPNKIVYLETFDVSMIKRSESSADCGSFYCGHHAGPVVSIRPDPDVSFAYSYEIPSADSTGSYEITVDAGFATKSVTFEVVDAPPATPPSSTSPSRIIDKVNRIAETHVSIAPESKRSGGDGQELVPRVLSGSLLTPARGEESAVNLQIVSPGGICIIGQSEGCLVSDSTRTQGSIYSVVSFGGSDYNVRYSGPGATFEKFSILPVSDGAALPPEPFDVYVIKGDQPSRFYYKITYVPPEQA